MFPIGARLWYMALHVVSSHYDETAASAAQGDASNVYAVLAISLGDG